MKINNEEILGFDLYGLECEHDINDKPIKTFKELCEQYEATKRFDKQEGWKDTYLVRILTETMEYEGYALRKYKGKYNLKPTKYYCAYEVEVIQIGKKKS